MILQEFTKGLNTRKAPELLSPQEATVCDNTDLSAGVIRPLLGLGTPIVAVGASYYATNLSAWQLGANTTTFVEFKAGLYSTKVGGAPLKLVKGVTSALGIVAPLLPTFTLPVLPVVVPNAFWVDAAATYNSAKQWGTTWAPVTVIAKLNFAHDVATTVPLIVPTLNKITVYNQSIAPAAPIIGDLWYDTTTTTTRTYTVNNNIISLTGVVTPGTPTTYTEPYGSVFRWDGLSWVMTAQPVRSSVALAFTLPWGAVISQVVYRQAQTPSTYREVVQYAITYYNIADGTESAPSPLSASFTVSNLAAQSVSIALGVQADPQVSHIFVYRIGGTLLNFTKVGEAVASPTIPVVYIDATPASAVVGQILTSNTNFPPPATLQYLTLSKGIFFGSIGSRLHFSSDLGNPNYWPAVNYIDFHAVITALAPVNNGLLVFTTYTTFLLLGTTPANMSQYLVSSSQGCLAHKSIAKLGHQVLFASSDGICLYTGNDIKVLTLANLGKQTFNIVTAELFDSTYYGLLSSGDVIQLDFRFGFAISYLRQGVAWLASRNDVLYAAPTLASPLQPLFQGLPLVYTYHTGLMIERQDSELKLFNKVYLAVKGAATTSVIITVYIDEMLVLTKNVTPSTKPQVLSIPQAQQRGSNISFGLVGTSDVIELEYKTVRRQNGR